MSPKTTVEDFEASANEMKTAAVAYLRDMIRRIEDGEKVVGLYAHISFEIGNNGPDLQVDTRCFYAVRGSVRDAFAASVRERAREGEVRLALKDGPIPPTDDGVLN